MNRKVRIIKGCYEGRTGNIIKVYHVYALVKLDGFNKNIAFLHKEYEIIEEQKGKHMAKDCYLEIDGKRTKLTDEQLKALGLYEEPKQSPFERVEIRKTYYNISTAGDVVSSYEANDNDDNSRYKAANYCTNNEILQQRALHETLNRLLWRFSIENDGSKINWNNRDQLKYLIYFDNESKKLSITDCRFSKIDGCICFYSKSIAQKAIKEIVLPFMKEHPDFVW